MATKIGTAYVDVKGDFTTLNKGVASALAPTKLGKLGTAGGLAISGALAAAVGGAAIAKATYDLGSEFDKAFDKIRVGTGKTGKQLKGLEKDFKAVYANVPSSMEDVAAAVAGLNTRLGLTGKPLQVMAQNIVELSDITGTDLEGNLRGVARAFVDWEVPVKNQTKALDGFYRLSQQSGVSVADITSEIQKFGSPLRTLGFGIDEAAAMFATFERAGVNAQTMVPGFKLAIGNLVQPTAKLKVRLKDLGVSVGKPKKAIKEVMALLGNKSNLKDMDKITLAMQVFGKRAGADMKEAIKQGRFNLKNYIDTFKHGKDTIAGSADDVHSFGQQWEIFTHRVKNEFQPVASGFFDSLGDGMAALNSDDGMDRLVKKNKHFADSIKVLKVAFKVAFSAIKTVIWAFLQFFTLVPKMIGDIFGVIKHVFRAALKAVTGDWSGAWKEIKGGLRDALSFFKHYFGLLTLPFRYAFKGISSIMKSTMSGAWDSVTSIFEDGGNAVIDVLNKVIDAINLIPNVDIGHIGHIGGTDKRSLSPGGKTPRTGRQRGGVMVGGKPTGDSIPAVLERGEYVLNSKAVKHVGVQALDDLNFRKASRFQTGGPVGMLFGGLGDASKNLAGDIGSAALSAAGKAPGGKLLADKGAAFFIDKLPKPDLPEPFTGVGPYMIDKVSDWISGHVKKEPTGPTGGTRGPNGIGTYGGLPMAIWVIEALKHAASKGVAPAPTSGYRTHAENVAKGRNYVSEHEGTQYPHGAADFGGYTSGLAAKMSVVNATSDFKYPLLAPIGFRDDGHASGTGHQLGGLIRRMQRGGHQGSGSKWTRTGYTVYDDPPPGAFGALDNGYAELGTATSGGVGTGTGFLAQAMGRSGELPANFPLDVKINGKRKTMRKRDRGYGQGTSSYGLDVWKDSWGFFGLNASSKGQAYVKPGDGSGGDSGPSAADRAASKRKKLVNSRTDLIDTLRGKVRDADNPRAKKSALWKLIKGWAMFGDLDKKVKARIASVTKGVAGRMSPTGGISSLQHLATYLHDKVKISGDEKGNEGFADRIGDIQSAATKRAQKKRKRKLSRISTKGENYPLKGKLLNLDESMAIMAEKIEVKERDHSADWSADGSDLSKGEIAEQIGLNTQLLGMEDQKQGWLAKSMANVAKKQAVYKKLMAQAKPKKSPSHWKYGAFKSSYSSSKDTLASLIDDTHALLGLTGHGGERGDTLYRLQELGHTAAGGSSSDSGIGISDVLKIVEAAKYNVFDRMPQFHTGGTVAGSGHEEVMALVKARESIYTDEQNTRLAGALTSTGTPEITVIVHDDAVDSSKIEVIADGRILKHDRKKSDLALAGVR